MDQRTIQILFALLRSVICGTKLPEKERDNYSPDLLQDLLKISSKHDVVHLLALGLKQNELITQEGVEIEKNILKAFYRYERTRYEYENLCAILEKAQVPFLPLKGAVLRKYYPEAWMRTSCDIDVLVHPEDLEKAVSCLVIHPNYVKKERTTHDVSLFTKTGIHVEIHFDLVEEGRAQNAIDVLKSVWKNATLHANSEYWYEMNDAFFYFYHIAHMAKHFEGGGCGIRPFIDLWILDHMKNIDLAARDSLLSQGGLLKFSDESRTLSQVWFDGKEPDKLSLQMQDFILHGGVYGSTDNRVALRQKKKGGRMGYVLSRMFLPYAKLKRYYPVLEKHRWLTPVLQIRRWFKIFTGGRFKRSINELKINNSISNEQSEQMQVFLKQLGL